jgi:hypothetical protein
MAFHNHPNYRNNSKFTSMGVGPHDYAAYTYGTGGGTSASNLIQIDYYVGGQQASGTLVGTIIYTYDANDNITSSERIA